MNVASVFFDIEKDLSTAVNVGEGFDIYEITGSEIVKEKNIIDSGEKVNISFLKNFINPEICLGLTDTSFSRDINKQKNRSKLKPNFSKTKNMDIIRNDFFFVGRKSSSKNYLVPLFFQDKSLLNKCQIKFQDFYLGGNVYGCFFNTRFGFKKINMFDNEMASSINSFFDSCSCPFFKVADKNTIDTTVLDFSQKILNLDNILGANAPLKNLIKKIVENNMENSLFNCSQKMSKKILDNFMLILDNKELAERNIKLVKLAKNGDFSIGDISDFYIEYRERRYYKSSNYNSFFVVKGKNNRIFLLYFFDNKEVKFAKVYNVLKSYSRIADITKLFIKSFSTEIFINER